MALSQGKPAANLLPGSSQGHLSNKLQNGQHVFTQGGGVKTLRKMSRNRGKHCLFNVL
jgi:hypothetical protein